MGGDGGVVPSKRKFMEHGQSKTGGESQNRVLTAQHRIGHCRVSDEPLAEPIAACELGNLYNKDALLDRLLNKTLDGAFKHIRGLRDVITCRFTPSAGEGGGAVPYMCPITRTPFTHAQPFVVVRTTGWVLSDAAVRELGVAALQADHGPFEDDDLIRLLPEAEEEAALRRRMQARRERRHAEKERRKKDKKSKKKSKEAARARAAAPPTLRTPSTAMVQGVAAAARAAVSAQAGRDAFKSIFAPGPGDGS